MKTFPEMLQDDGAQWLDEALSKDATRRRSTMPAGAAIPLHKPVEDWTQDEEEALERMLAGQDALDKQVGGDHYKHYAIQPIRFSMLNKLNACQHSAIKYIVRKKGDKAKRLEDIDKAVHFLEIYREMIRTGEAE